MDKEEYGILLKDWRWKERRSEILQMDDYTCQRCYADRSDDILLNVHHKYYIEGRMPWDYPDDALVTLCEECHKKSIKKTKSKYIRRKIWFTRKHLLYLNNYSLKKLSL